MTHLSLAGGTDVAEVALFSTDTLPGKRKLNGEVLDELERSESMVRFATGGDGSYLLHVYVNQEIPPSISVHCLQDDSKTGNFLAASGSVAFGGVESAACDYLPNEHIRSDGVIPAGKYEYVAFHTEFPEEESSTYPGSSLGRAERIVAAIPNTGPPVAFLLIAVALGFQQYALAIILFLASWAVIKMCRHTATFKRAIAERKERDMQYPSIVVSLRSNPSIERTASSGLCPPPAASHVER